MSTVKVINAQIGQSSTATQNFTLTAAAADGTMKLARGNQGSTTQDVLKVDGSGNINLPQNLSVTGALGVTGAVTLASTPAVTTAQSMVMLNTANGYGSTNSMIRRFTNVVTNQGTDITYADSATLGGSFTINTSGVYAISYGDNFTGSSNAMGVSLNSAQLTTPIGSITPANRPAASYTSAANAPQTVSWTGYISAGGVVRAHADGGTTGSSIPAQFTITRVA